MKKFLVVLLLLKILTLPNLVLAKSCPVDIEGKDGNTIVAANKKEYCISSNMMDWSSAHEWCKKLGQKLPTAKELCGTSVSSFNATCKGSKSNPNFAPAYFENGEKMPNMFFVWINAGFPTGLGTAVEATKGYIYNGMDFAHALCEDDSEQREKIIKKESVLKEIINNEANYSLGNPNGKFVIIEFFDYNCGWCKKNQIAMRHVLNNPEAQNIRFIPIDVPIFGKQSEIISSYVLAAGKQGKYEEMHNAVLDSNELNDLTVKLSKLAMDYVKQNKLHPDEKQEDFKKIRTYQDNLAINEYPSVLLKIGKSIGLNEEKLKVVAENKEVQDKIENNKQYLKKLNLDGVPVSSINGKIHEGALSSDEIKKIIKDSQQ